MNTTTVKVRLVDGGLQELSYGPEFVQALRSLEARGYSGKRLIHELITDDWAAQPLVVEVQGTGADGNVVDVRIPYR